MLRKVEVLQCLLMVVQLHAVFAVFLDLLGGGGLISPIHGQLPCYLTNTQLHQLHPCQTTRGWHSGGLHRSMLALAETLLCRLSMGKYMHKQTQPQNHNSSISMSLQFTESLFPSTLWGGGNGKLAKLCRSAWHVLWDLHGDGISSIAGYITELVKTPSSGPEPPSVIGTRASWEGY